MRYLKHFESFDEQMVSKTDYATKEQIPSVEINTAHNKFLEYLQKLSYSEKLKLKSDLEKFAKDHNVTLEQLEDPKLVEELLGTNVNEGVGDWLKKNWYNLVDKVSKYTGIFALITFLGSMALYWTGGFETLMGVKVAAAAWIISQAVGALRGLK